MRDISRAMSMFRRVVSGEKCTDVAKGYGISRVRVNYLVLWVSHAARRYRDLVPNDGPSSGSIAELRENSDFWCNLADEIEFRLSNVGEKLLCWEGNFGDRKGLIIAANQKEAIETSGIDSVYQFRKRWSCSYRMAVPAGLKRRSIYVANGNGYAVLDSATGESNETNEKT